MVFVKSPLWYGYEEYLQKIHGENEALMVLYTFRGERGLRKASTVGKEEIKKEIKASKPACRQASKWKIKQTRPAIKTRIDQERMLAIKVARMQASE